MSYKISLYIDSAQRESELKQAGSPSRAEQGKPVSTAPQQGVFGSNGQRSFAVPGSIAALLINAPLVNFLAYLE